MKKLLNIIVGMVIFISVSTVCYAGSVPEDLLYYDSSQVYFGKVKKVDGDGITVIQQKNIKGDFTQDSVLEYKRFISTNLPEIGSTYICGYFDENNPLYVWDVTSQDTKTLIIKNINSMSRSNMSQRMQEYLNEGKFEEKEKERLMRSDIKEGTELTTSESTTEIIADSRDQTDNNSSIGTRYLIILSLCSVILIGIVLRERIKRKNRY